MKTIFYKYLEHGSYVFHMSSRGKCSMDLADSFNQRLGCLGHLFHFLIIQKSSLLFILKVWTRKKAHSLLQKFQSMLSAEITMTFNFMIDKAKLIS